MANFRLCRYSSSKMLSLGTIEKDQHYENTYLITGYNVLPAFSDMITFTVNVIDFQEVNCFCIYDI